ncbi:hypothetical protein C1H76_2027 [Elsinoe australis]|uniref:F-box domain-containing protein n=1 Tax=Elsinoe australis TaxID=40998 RepID=A0A4U7BCR0_9PEZI|nr:hypothetical protein C1H76_2027 [Elsinoe australis]
MAATSFSEEELLVKTLLRQMDYKELLLAQRVSKAIRVITTKTPEFQQRLFLTPLQSNAQYKVLIKQPSAAHLKTYHEHGLRCRAGGGCWGDVFQATDSPNDFYWQPALVAHPLLSLYDDRCANDFSMRVPKVVPGWEESSESPIGYLAGLPQDERPGWMKLLVCQPPAAHGKITFWMEAKETREWMKQVPDVTYLTSREVSLDATDGIGLRWDQIIANGAEQEREAKPTSVVRVDLSLFPKDTYEGQSWGRVPHNGIKSNGKPIPPYVLCGQSSEQHRAGQAQRICQDCGRVRIQVDSEGIGRKEHAFIRRVEEVGDVEGENLPEGGNTVNE